MDNARFISAICTPLDDRDGFNADGLAAHVEAQWAAGIDGILVAGTMGLLQLLRDDVYQDLCRRSIELTRGRGEVMVGAGDASLARTLARVEFLNTLRGVDAVVVLAPYFMQFSQAELIDYYRAIADAARAPVYLYDLPQRTRSKIEAPTVLELLKHPRIKGIKCSDEIAVTRQLIGEVGGRGRVIVAQPLLVDTLLREGIREHLDGVFSLVPHWTVAIGRAADVGDWHRASLYQAKLAAILKVLVKYGVFPASTAVLNACGVAGRAGPRPYRMLESAAVEQLLAEPIVVELLRGPEADDGGVRVESVSESGLR